MTTVSEYYYQKTGLEVIAGRRGYKCFLCNHETVSIKVDNTLAKCFHPRCDWYITAAQINRSQYEDSLNEILDQILIDFHAALHQQKGSGNEDGYSYLKDKRKIDDRVIEDAMIGVVPEGYNATPLFDNCITNLSARLRTANDATRSSLEANIERMEAVKERLAGCLRGKGGWLCFFLTDPQLRITSIKLRKPYAETKKMASCKISKTLGVFGRGLFTDLKNPESLVVVEGEIDLLKLQSVYLQNFGQADENAYMDAVAICGASSPDFEAINEICRYPTFLYDNDDAGLEVLNKAREHMHFKGFTVPAPYNDIDEYFVKCFEEEPGEAWESYTQLLEKAQKYYRYFSAVAREVQSIRLGSGKAFLINQRVARVILEDLYGRGSFYKASGEGYYFHEEEKSLLQLGKDDAKLTLLLSYYGINSSESIFNYMYSHIRNDCYRNGTDSRIHTFAHYNKERNILYLVKDHGQIYKILPSSIEIVPNGTDGVLFLVKPNWKTFEIVEYEGNPLFEELIAPINFTKDHITLKEKWYLLELWFYSLFFEAIMPTKAIMTILGEKGSGKTFVLRMIGKLLFGEHFDVTPLPNDPKDFDVIAVNSDYMVIDNADSKAPWLEDRLATLSTGGSLKMRTLFTNMGLMEVEPHCFLAITARTPYFRRDDVADRLLIFRVDRIDKFLPENELLDSLMKKRNKIMSNVLHRLQVILKAMDVHKGDVYSGQLRMADFASLAYRIALQDGEKEMIESIFAKISTEQATFTLERNPIMDLISLWLIQGDNVGRFVTNKELYTELKAISIEHGEPLAYKSHLNFAQKMTNIRSNLESFYEIEEKLISGNQKMYAFSYKPYIVPLS